MGTQGRMSAMRMARGFGWRRIAALLAVLAVPARAQERPPLIPTRDADVLYDLPGDNLTERLRWSEALRTLRVDPPGAGLYMLVDYAAGRMRWVDPARRAVMEGPAPDARNAVVGEGDGRYGRAGTGSVAGLACTLWRTADARGTPMTLCLTPEGVLLQVSVAGTVALRARSVSFAPTPPDVLRVPDGFSRAALPTVREAGPAPDATATGGGARGAVPGAAPSGGGSALSVPMIGAAGTGLPAAGSAR